MKLAHSLLSVVAVFTLGKRRGHYRVPRSESQGSLEDPGRKSQTGAISATERQNGIEQIHIEQAAGRFVAGLTYRFVWGTVAQRSA